MIAKKDEDIVTEHDKEWARMLLSMSLAEVTALLPEEQRREAPGYSKLKSDAAKTRKR
jgi:hypothetical protein